MFCVLKNDNVLSNDYLYYYANKYLVEWFFWIKING